jgi:hypothetical protein
VRTWTSAGGAASAAVQLARPASSVMRHATRRNELGMIVSDA